MNEKAVQRSVLAYIDSLPGWIADRLDPSGSPGVPDIYRREQRAWHETARRQRDTRCNQHRADAPDALLGGTE